MNPMSKKPSTQNLGQQISTFLMSPILYQTCPPKPTAHSKQYRVALDPSRHIVHKIHPTFVYQSKGLFTRCDVGLPLEDLIVGFGDYEGTNSTNNNNNNEIDEEDLMLVKEIVDDRSNTK